MPAWDRVVADEPPWEGSGLLVTRRASSRAMSRAGVASEANQL